MLEGDQVKCGQPATFSSRQMLMLNQLWLPLGSCVCACPCEPVVFVDFLMCVLGRNCDEMRAKPHLESPLCPFGRKCFPRLSGWHIHSQTLSDLYLCLGFLRMESLGPNAPLGTAMFIICDRRKPPSLWQAETLEGRFCRLSLSETKWQSEDT